MGFPAQQRHHDLSGTVRAVPRSPDEGFRKEGITVGDYVYLATNIETGTPVAAFPVKHELERWAWREDAGPELPLDEWCRLWRVSSFPQEWFCQVIELELKNDRLVEKRGTK